MRRALWLALAVVLLATALAGCLSDDGPQTDREPGANGTAETGPAPGCDPERSAVAHHPGGRIADADGPAPIPCLTRTGHNSGEPTIGISDNGTVFIHPATEALGEVTGRYPVGLARSTDQGATWDKVLPNLRGQATHRVSNDPFLHRDSDTDRLFVDDQHPPFTCSLLSWSDDGGESWNRSEAGCMETDHQNVFTGPPTTSETVGYPNVVYRCAINGGRQAQFSTATTCQRSLDGGLNWLPPGEPAFVTQPGETGHRGHPWCGGGSGHGVTGPDGTVYLPKGLCGQPWLAVSEDEGMTWRRVQVADNGMRIDENGKQAHEAGVAVDENGNVYYTWVARDRIPYLAVSIDGAETFGEPMQIGHPNLFQASLPAIDVGAEGRVAIAYVGSTNAPKGPWKVCQDPTPTGELCSFDRSSYDNATWNGYITVTSEARSSDPTFYSAPVNDPTDPLVRGYCGALRCLEILDFIDVAIGPNGTAWAPFVDGCTPDDCPPGRDEPGEAVAGRLFGGPSLVAETD